MEVWGWTLLIYALATARLTGLVTADELTRPLRERAQYALGRRYNVMADEWEPAPNAPREALATLTTCGWCCSIWIAAFVAPVAWWFGSTPWALIPALVLAFSFVAGALSDLGRA